MDEETLLLDARQGQSTTKSFFDVMMKSPARGQRSKISTLQESAGTIPVNQFHGIVSGFAGTSNAGEVNSTPNRPSAGTFQRTIPSAHSMSPTQVLPPAPNTGTTSMWSPAVQTPAVPMQQQIQTMKTPDRGGYGIPQSFGTPYTPIAPQTPYYNTPSSASVVQQTPNRTTPRLQPMHSKTKSSQHSKLFSSMKMATLLSVSELLYYSSSQARFQNSGSTSRLLGKRSHDEMRDAFENVGIVELIASISSINHSNNHHTVFTLTDSNTHSASELNTLPCDYYAMSISWPMEIQPGSLVRVVGKMNFHERAFPRMLVYKIVSLEPQQLEHYQRFKNTFDIQE